MTLLGRLAREPVLQFLLVGAVAFALFGRRDASPRVIEVDQGVRSALRRDFERLLANEGSLSNYIAYGRLGYQIILRLHTANPLSPVQETHIESVPAPANDADHAALETPP